MKDLIGRAIHRLSYGILACGVALASLPASGAKAAGPSASVVEPYGRVEVAKLPSFRPSAGSAIILPRKFPNVDVLAAQKAAFLPTGAHKPDKGGGGGGGHGKPTPTPTPTPAPTPTPVPTTSASFAGLQFSDSGGWVPPDTILAAGPTYIFEAVNLAGRIADKNGNTVSTFSLFNFFNLPTSTELTDPRVLFDPSSGRWFVVTTTVNKSKTPGGWNLAVSASSDPTGAFYLYSFSTGKSFPDFPKMGVNYDKVALSGDIFSGNNFLGTEFLVLNKSNLINGQAVSVDTYPAPQGDYAIEPALDLTENTTSDTMYMAAAAYASASSVEVWSVTGVPGVGSGSQVTEKSLPFSSAAYTGPATPSTLSTPPDAAQCNTNTTVVTNDNALLDAMYRSGSLWVSANDACTPETDTAVRSCLRFIEISIPAGASAANASIAENFDVGVHGEYLYYPAVRTDKYGNMASVFSESSGSQCPSVAEITQQAGGTPGSPALVNPGSAAYTQANRWGDYSGASVDPTDDSTFWLAAEYATTEPCSSGQCSAWGTWINSATAP